MGVFAYNSSQNSTYNIEYSFFVLKNILLRVRSTTAVPMARRVTVPCSHAEFMRPSNVRARRSHRDRSSTRSAAACSR
jgi:hypothetical protein